MVDSRLRRKLIRLAYEKPELRPLLLPLVKKAYAGYSTVEDVLEPTLPKMLALAEAELRKRAKADIPGFQKVTIEVDNRNLLLVSLFFEEEDPKEAVKKAQEFIGFDAELHDGRRPGMWEAYGLYSLKQLTS